MTKGTHIHVILDRSGSMSSIKDDIIGGFNEFLQQQKKLDDACTLSLVQFDSDDAYEVVHDFCAQRNWIANLATNPTTYSNTSVCLKFTDDRILDGASFAKAIAKRLENEGVAVDIGSYRDAPAGLRIWCGATVETSDIEALMPWLDWAFETEINTVLKAA